ncbi:MAG: Dabb family protein [Roseiarcus sp.]
MIRHTVFVKFPADARPEAIGALFGALDDLRAVVPGMLSFHGGANVSPEGLARGFTHAFVADFADAAARDAYLVHPAHRAAGARLVAAAASGRDGLIVIDIEIAG